MTGHFIVLEGLDGAGTTTQSRRLNAWLTARGHTVVQTHEPTDGPVGRLIRQGLRGVEGSVAMTTFPWMFAADRADHLTRLVEPSLREGTWVISDRYMHSSLAYQSLTLPLEDVYDLNRTFRVPDLTVFVRASVDVCLQRITARGGELDIYERRDRLEAISGAYDRVLERLIARGDPIVEVDGEASIDDVEANIRGAVERLGS
jgi:dTMP kinase